MKKGYIVSAILGAGFVAVPLFMGIETPIAVGMGVVAYVAGNLIFSEKETDIKFERKDDDYEQKETCHFRRKDKRTSKRLARLWRDDSSL